MADGNIVYQGSRWEMCPGFLEVIGGPWGEDVTFGADVVGSWKAAIDWHADNGLNLIIANIPYGRTDYNYLGWPFHYIVDMSQWPHHEDLFDDDFRARNVELLNRVFAHAKDRGVTCLAHHFNFHAPRRMAGACGWAPRYAVDGADWVDGSYGISRMDDLVHNCCWNVESYRQFMDHCWRETCRLLPNLSGFLVTPGEANRGQFPDAGAHSEDDAYLYNSDARYTDTMADFIRTFDATLRDVGRMPVVRSWGVEGAPHLMPTGVTYLIKHQLFDTIDAPGDPLVDRWVAAGHEMWIEAMTIGENAGPILWADAEHFAKLGQGVRGSGVSGAVAVSKYGSLNRVGEYLGALQFHAGVRGESHDWVEHLRPAFGDDAADALEAMRLVARGVLLISKVSHRLGEGHSFGYWPTFTPPLDGFHNLGAVNGTPPPWARGDVVALKEYLDYLATHPCEPGCLDRVRGERRCPIESLAAAADDAHRAGEILDRIARPGEIDWLMLRCAAGVGRGQARLFAEACRAKVLFEQVRACPVPEDQPEYARQCMQAFADAEAALAYMKRWLVQLPPLNHLPLKYCEAMAKMYRNMVQQFEPYKRDLRRLLDGQAWTLSRCDLMWRAIHLDGPGTQGGEHLKPVMRQPPWPQ